MTKSNASSALPEDYNPEAPAVYDPEIDGDEQEANPDANRVLADHIATLMELVEVFVSVHPGTTTTIATVYLPNGYALATETSSCNDPSLFDPEIGAKIAIKRARHKAENKLWELEGYRMMTMLHLQPGSLPRPMEE